MITIECKTDRFNLSDVKEDFINDCCFGEDFSNWITEELTKNGAQSDVVCMEDFGWFNAVESNNQIYGLAISGYSEEQEDNPNYGSWFLSFDKNRKFKEVIFGKNKESKDEPIFELVIKILTEGGFDQVQFST